MTTPKSPRPSQDSRKTHTSIALTSRQAERIRAGQNESKPSDYANLRGSEALQRRNEARRILEERQMLRDLGLL